MSTFKVRFHLDGNDYQVLACEYSFKQEVDRTGKPVAVNNGGMIDITVLGSDDTTIVDWMVSNFDRRAGKIVYLKPDTEAVLKEVEFEDGYCVSYKENFNADNEHPMTETFSISARVIKVGSVEHENDWAAMV